MKLQLIQIEVFDNLFSIKEKLIHSKSESILLIDQPGSPIFQDKKQARLIQRTMLKTGKEVAVVTQNSTAASTLKDVGINSFYDIDSAQRFPWGSRDFSGKKTWLVKKNRSSFLKNVIKESQVTTLARIGSLVVGIASVIILAVLFIPSAEIKIKVPLQNQTIQIPLQINSSNLTSGSNQIYVTPTITDVEVFQTAKTTGKIDVPVEKAKGTLDFVNLTDDVVNIPEGLILRSSVDEKKEYITTESGEMQAGVSSMLSLQVEAVESGEKGNAEVGEITFILGPFGLRLTASNSQAIQGGSDLGKSAPSETDRNKLLQDCMEEIKKNANLQIQSNLRQDEIFLPETMKITEILLEDYFPVDDTPSDVLSLSLRAQVSSMIISRERLTAFSKPYLDVLLPEKNNAASGISISNIDFIRMNQDGSIHVIITASRLIKMVINLDEIKSLSSGRPKNEVIRILEQQYHQNAPDVITIHPGWIQDLSRIPLRINVEVEE